MADPLPLPDAEQKPALKETNASFWVTASAGSGKTMLLTQRFLALLLEGAAPQRILCLTYTRAAASEMASRIMSALQSCTERHEAARLYHAFFDKEPDEKTLERATELHTRSLDCKGGLRIMTFHAFCQSVLGKFPLESGVAPHFQLVEQGRKQQLGRDALFAAQVSAQKLIPINDFFSLEACAACVSEIAARARSPKELAHAKATLRLLFAPSKELTQETTKEITQEITQEPLPITRLQQLEELLRKKQSNLKSSDLKKLQKLTNWLESREEEDYRTLFLTSKGLLPKNPFLTKSTRALLPADLEADVTHERKRLARQVREKERERLLALNLALVELAEGSAKDLAQRHNRQALLDFDDLIDKTQALLNSERTPWVHYKLDGSFDHVLIDEAQDTNHAQWSIVEQLTEEIFTHPARLPQKERRARSLFVVGDEKQSIYSFQGADLQRFVAARERFRARAQQAGLTLHEHTLSYSYRSLAPVLQAIDQTFEAPEMLSSLQALQPERPQLDEQHTPRPLRHKAQRKERGGSASLHLLSLNNESSHKNSPMPAAEQKEAWADSIAAFVADNILNVSAEAPRLSCGRKARAGDVLLLLPQRTQLMQPLLVAFAEKKLPCEDIDKFNLTETLQAEDVLAWLRFLVLPHDEINLASLLKTPFLGVSEEALQTLCLVRIERGEGLWQALSNSKDLRQAYEWLAHPRAFVERMSPFEALRFLLERPCPRADSGSAALLAAHRNLDPAENLCEEALVFEQNATLKTLPQFLAHLTRLQIGIKRESVTQPTDKMRMMTIHGAKGLESPIVILPLFYLKKARASSLTLWREGEYDNPTSLYLPADSLAMLEGDERENSLGTRLQRQREQQAQDQIKEQQRLLYVAMTRARDHLVMLAPKTDAPSAPSAHYAETWSAHLKAVVQKNRWQKGQDDTESKAAEKTEQPKKAQATTHYFLGEAAQHLDEIEFDADNAQEASVSRDSDDKPSFLFLSPPTEKPMLAPRSATHRKVRSAPRAFSPILDRRQRGIIFHSLLQNLAESGERANEKQARELLLQALQPFALKDTERNTFVEEGVAKTLHLLTQPPFFGKGCATPAFEIEIAGNLAQGRFTGRIDLLREDATTRHFGDLKTDAVVPQQIPQPYASQFGVYRALLEALRPQKRVEGYVLWFETGEVQKLTEEDMPTPTLEAEEESQPA